MKRTSISKFLMASILSALLVLPFISASFSNTMNTQASGVVARTTSQPTMPPPQPVNVLRAFAPFWRIGNGYSSALIIRNTSQQLSASATPIVFTTDARPTWLPAVQLAAKLRESTWKKLYQRRTLLQKLGRLQFKSIQHNPTPLSAKW